MRGARRATTLLLLALLSCGCTQPEDPAPDLSPTARVAFYEAQLRAHPRHWPALARLGLAWVDRARETLDPAHLARARQALERSREVQDNFEARKGLAAAAAFAHRFDEAERWLESARAANSEDSGLVALEVEVALARGRIGDARARLAGEALEDFHVASARAALALAEGELERAAAAFGRAAERAREQGVETLATWAGVRAAGVFLDAGRLDEARPMLQAIALATPDDRELRVHLSELREREGDLAGALAEVLLLLDERQEPELDARAAALARALGDEPRAQRHRDRAERTLRGAVEAGEVYTLGALARLLAESDGDLDEALALAERNLEHVSDADALRTLAEIRLRSAAQR